MLDFPTPDDPSSAIVTPGVMYASNPSSPPGTRVLATTTGAAPAIADVSAKRADASGHKSALLSTITARAPNRRDDAQ